ncbi:MAG: Fic family protein [Sedimentisphaerales bacterium]|nr:Fic family protein [Sedimentisphaerales bacterium]
MRPYTPQKLPLKDLDYNPFVHLVSLSNRQISRFDGIVMNMLNPQILLSPLTTNEAVLSSRIEGTQATFEEVLKFEAEPKKPTKKYDDIQEIINYRKTLRYAMDRTKDLPLCGRLMREMHNILLDSVRGHNRQRGEFRTSQVHIGPPGCPIEKATYIPPSCEKIGEAISNLEKYLRFDEKDILVQTAILHAQFEIIHPFLDGNGRIGRLLIPLFLYEKKVLSYPSFYMSEYFNNNREQYYDSLNKISKKNDWIQWIIFFLTAVNDQAQVNINRATKILNLYMSSKDKMVKLTHSQFSIQALDFIFNRPVFSSPQFYEGSGIPRPTAARILDILKEAKVLTVIDPGKGRHPTTYAFVELIDVVD